MYKLNKIELNLIVPSIEDTVEWYEEVLGWEGELDVFDKDENCSFGSVKRDEFGFNLIRAVKKKKKRDPNFTILIHVDDVDEVYRTIEESDWEAENKPEDTFWGGRIFSIKDLNGYRLQFVEMIEDIDLEEIRERHAEMEE